MFRSTRYLNPLLRLGLIAGLLLATSALTAKAQSDPKKTSPPASAESAASKKKPSTYIRGYYAIIAKETKLSKEQRQKMEVALTARAAALESFDQTNKDKIKALANAAVKSKASNQPEKARSQASEARVLRAKRKKLEDNHREKVLSVMTPQQRQIVAGFNLYMGAVQKFRKAEITAKQKAAIKALALKQGTAITPATDAKALRTIKSDLSASIESDVLTADQRAKLAALKRNPVNQIVPKPSYVSCAPPRATCIDREHMKQMFGHMGKKVFRV